MYSDKIAINKCVLTYYNNTNIERLWKSSMTFFFILLHLVIADIWVTLQASDLLSMFIEYILNEYIPKVIPVENDKTN